MIATLGLSTEDVCVADEPEGSSNGSGAALEFIEKDCAIYYLLTGIHVGSRTASHTGRWGTSWRDSCYGQCHWSNHMIIPPIEDGCVAWKPAACWYANNPDRKRPYLGTYPCWFGRNLAHSYITFLLKLPPCSSFSATIFYKRTCDKAFQISCLDASI